MCEQHVAVVVFQPWMDKTNTLHFGGSTLGLNTYRNRRLSLVAGCEQQYTIGPGHLYIPNKSLPSKLHNFDTAFFVVRAFIRIATSRALTSTQKK
jgi:hypothetical protein